MKNILPIILIAVSGGLFYLYINPQYEKVKELSSESERHDEILDKSVELRQIRSTLAQKVSGFSSADLNRLEKMLPLKIDIVKLALEIDNLALKNGFNIHNIKTAEVNKDDPKKGEIARQSKYGTLEINFIFDTNFSNLENFLKDLESSLKIIDIISVQAKAHKEIPQFQSYTMTVHTYWIK